MLSNKNITNKIAFITVDLETETRKSARRTTLLI